MDLNFKFLSQIFGSQNERTLKHMRPTVDRINSLEPEISRCSRVLRLKEKTPELKQRLAQGEKLR